MVKIKAVFYSVFDHIYRKAETIARWAPGVNRVQPELARIPHGVLEQSGKKRTGNL